MALTLAASLDRTSIEPRGGRVNLVLAVTASRDEGRPEPRPPSATVLALDVSYSMAGEPLAHVVHSVDRLLEGFAPPACLGVVSFSDEATVVVPLAAADGEGKRLVRARVARLRANGRTNVEAGLEAGAAMLARAPAAARRAIVLLSDGAPNVGRSTLEELRELARRLRPDISIASLGYGLDHQEDVLSAIGEAGGGGYELVLDPSSCARSFARVLGAQADVVASGIELVLLPAAGVTVERLLSGEALRFGREGGVVAVGDLGAGARAVVVAELLVAAPGTRFLADVIEVSMRWHRPGARGEALTARETVTVEVADAPPRTVSPAAEDVLLVRAERARGEARALADRGQFRSAAVLLRGIAEELAAFGATIPGARPPLVEAHELLVDEVGALERAPDPEQWSAFRKAAVASKLTGAVPSVRVRGPASAHLLDLTAGVIPEAWVEVSEGPEKGTRFRLGPEAVVGRTASAEIALPSAEVARRHAEIYALEGAFFVADLGSTSPTRVNGKVLGAVPHALVDGDRIKVGDVTLVYRASSP